VSDSPAPTSAPNGSEATPPDAQGERPTRVRYGVLVFLAAMTFILYIDRSCINQAGPVIKRELAMSDTQLGIVFYAFAFAYAVFEIPAGWWGDRYGSRRILTRIVVWWSVFTALTGMAWGFGTLVLIRFLFGAGEAGALPNAARVLRGWFPDATRGRAQGFVTTAMMIGGAAAPVASQWLINRVGWRWSFVVFALAGVAWAMAFYAWFCDDPADHPDTNEAERRLIAAGRTPPVPVNAAQEEHAAGLTNTTGEIQGRIPWDRVFSCGNLWLLGGVMITMSAMYDVLSSWYPTYLQEARGASPTQSSQLASLVLAAGAFGAFFGGWLTDWLVQTTGNLRWGRTAQAVAGTGLSALGILASVWTDSTGMASAFVAVAAFGAQLQLPAWWASATQVSGRHLGALFGMMNMMGGVGRLAQILVGGMADWRKSLGYTGRAQWDPALYAYVVVALLGMFLWSRIDPQNTVDDDTAESTQRHV
jgi:MFS family permease